MNTFFTTQFLYKKLEVGKCAGIQYLHSNKYPAVLFECILRVDLKLRQTDLQKSEVKCPFNKKQGGAAHMADNTQEELI